ncbi:hypothetical protein GH714_003787 [Hevea brasiliensis]|uniref:Protein kinase domain-containing protein n=1 Tax=Hevea brasiliensis TaxID=3981 RepID=A0A6A6KHV2_HEVBR|nr:hypothetical protein GH714_003787 [Hevea brasiliensis]
MKILSFLLALTFLLPLFFLSQTNADLYSDKQALLNFAAAVPHSRKLNWKSTTPVCTSWIGITCNANGSHVLAVRLPGVGLYGPIPANTLGKLDHLTTLSLRSNFFSGELPSDLLSLPSLQSVYLQHNNFSGHLGGGNNSSCEEVKRSGGREREFEQQMEAVGRVGQHPNVIPLRAYYYSKDEKLLVYDYVTAGSLFSLLHGSNNFGRTPLDWDSRVKISLGTARGIAHIHSAGGGKFIHGNIRSSNVLLTQDLQLHGCISDFGLTPIMSYPSVPCRCAGYRAPEVIETRKSTQKSDVYSFGVLLLEMLTGKAPVKSAGQDDLVDLPRWVQSVVREEWTAEVFDVELMRYHNIEEEMVQMLQIAMACVARVPDMRPTMDEVIRMIEEIRPTDSVSQPSEEKKGSDTHIPSSIYP